MKNNILLYSKNILINIIIICDVDDTFLPADPKYNKSWNTGIVYI